MRGLSFKKIIRKQNGYEKNLGIMIHDNLLLEIHTDKSTAEVCFLIRNIKTTFTYLSR